jgi:hypothetical protein
MAEIVFARYQISVFSSIFGFFNFFGVVKNTGVVLLPTGYRIF